MLDAKIKNLLVDFGGVLIDLDRSRCIDSFAQLGCRDIDRLLGICHQEGFFSRHEQGLISSEEFRNGIRGMTSLPLTDAQIDAAWNSFLVGIPSYRLECLLRLRRRYKVFLLSNTNEIHWQWACSNAFPWQAYRVDDYFDKIYLSFELKLVKPDPEIFKTVLADARIRPEETFFIDDSDKNCQVAQSLGISTYTPAAGEDWRHLFR